LLHLGLIDQATLADLSRSGPRRADYLEAGISIHEDLPSPSLPTPYACAVIRSYRTNRLSADRALDMLWGNLDRDDLPEPHTVPLDGMQRELTLE
jgi:hypothetical protein